MDISAGIQASLAGRYASALFDLASENGTVTAVESDLDKIEAALGAPLARPAANATLTAPGQMESHYAPGAPVRLNATIARPGETLLGFGRMACDLNLSPAGDLREAAANLFGHLHRLESTGQPIAVAPIPDHGLGRAINDRLRRAAAPRP